MFSTLEMAPPDAILGLNEAFAKDPNPRKINLGVGVFKDESGVTPILECVKQAEARLLESETTKSYLGIAGNPRYSELAQQLVFGSDHGVVTTGRAATVQTPGGTGALRLAADFIKSQLPGKRVWLSRPTWANHPNVFAAAGVEIDSYAYLDPPTHSLDFESMIADISKIPSGDVVLLHGCCHNPSGIDPTPRQWEKIADVLAERGLLPLIDFAYQGFGDGLEADAAGPRTICNALDEVLLASSFSKNFGLYCERVGTLTAVAESPEATAAVLSHLKACVRANYSNPPAHGAAIVSTVLADTELRDVWQRELTAMRDRINGIRSRFVESMRKYAPERDFSFIKRQRGMFSFSGLNRQQVDQLREKYSIYIVGSGRVNVAGITSSNVDRLCQSVAEVIS